MATISEIAKTAGVGVGTVSRYLNNEPHVSEPKKRKIQAAIDELHYTPSAIAAQLRSKTTKNIGFLVSRVTNPFLAALFDAVETDLKSHGYQVFVSQTHDDPSAEQRFLEQIKTHQLDGVIMASVENAELVQQMADEFPDSIVLLNEQIAHPGIRQVTLDHYQATLNGLEYLYQTGRRHIAYATGGDYPSHRHGQSRTQAYQDFHASYHLSIDSKLVFAKKHSLADGTLIGKTIADMSQAERPDAIFTNSDEVAIGVIAAVQAAGLRVPEDLAVMGYDDQPMAQFAAVPLTTIHQPVTAMAQQAVALLLAGLDAETQPVDSESTQLKLVIRKSA